MSTTRIIFILIFIMLLITAGMWWWLSDSSTVPVHHEYIEPTTPTNPAELTPLQEITEVSSDPYQTVLAHTYPDEYIIYPCPVAGEQTQVLLLTAKYTQSPAGNHLRDAKQAVREWEPYMLQDIGSIIYPNITPAELEQPIGFQDTATGDHRFTRLEINGQRTELHYGWLTSYVLFANTAACLEQVMDSIYETAFMLPMEEVAFRTI